MDNLELNKPPLGATAWHEDLNQNFTEIEQFVNDETQAASRKMHSEGGTVPDTEKENTWQEKQTFQEDVDIKGRASVVKDAEEARDIPPLEQVKWAAKAVGEICYIWDHLSGADVPPNDPNGPICYIKLSRDDPFNNEHNLLESERTENIFPGSGDPIEVDVADINTSNPVTLSGTVHLINSSGFFLKAGTSGEAQPDQMQRITGTLRNRHYFNSNSGAFTQRTDNQQVQYGTSGSGPATAHFDSAGSPDARTSESTDGETRPRNVGITAYMRIK